MENNEFLKLQESSKFLYDAIETAAQLNKEIISDNSGIRVIYFDKPERVWDVWFHDSKMMTFETLRDLFEFIDTESA